MLYSHPVAKRVHAEQDFDISAVLSLFLPWLSALMSMAAQDMWYSAINTCLP